MALIIFTDTVSEIISQCFVFLPMSVVYAKICPKRIEATSFALLASVSSLRGTIRSWLGAFINRQWVGVSFNDLSKYWVLVSIGFACSFLPLFFLWLIPTRKEIDELQESMQNKTIEYEEQASDSDEVASDQEEQALLFRRKSDVNKSAVSIKSSNDITEEVQSTNPTTARSMTSRGGSSASHHGSSGCLQGGSGDAPTWLVEDRLRDDIDEKTEVLY